MPPLSEVHLVCDADDLGHPLRRQMISLPDHLADLGEPAEAAPLGAAQRIRLEVRNYVVDEICDRPSFVLEGSIGLRLANPSTPEVGLQVPQQLAVLLVQRERERRPGFRARPSASSEWQRRCRSIPRPPPDRSRTRGPTGLRLHRRPYSLSEGRRVACRMN